MKKNIQHIIKTIGKNMILGKQEDNCINKVARGSNLTCGQYNCKFCTKLEDMKRIEDLTLCRMEEGYDTTTDIVAEIVELVIDSSIESVIETWCGDD